MQELLDLGFVELPNKRPACGVYALCDGDEVVYIGRSVNVYQRVRAHYNGFRGLWTKAFVIWCEEVDLDRIESEMIRHFEPRLNIYIPPPAESIIIPKTDFDLIGFLGLSKPKPDRRG